MGQRRKRKDFSFMTNKISIKNFSDILTEKKIKQDKCIEYYDFLIFLLENLEREYLGEEISDEKILFHHFNWLWNKICVGKYEKFSNVNENMCNDHLINSIYEIIYPSFYLSNREVSESVVYLKKIFEKIFILDKTTTIIDINTLIDLYEKFTRV